jgi:hypothetical protein
MKIETFEDVVELLKNNELLQQIAESKYYSGVAEQAMTTEAENICFEFVMAMSGVRDVVAAHYDMWGDDQLLILNLKDAVYLDWA